jgi:glycosyltransferase
MKITVVTVVKNNVENIKITIKSILSQKYKNFEYIIIDSNSTDGTSEYITQIKNNRIKYYRIKDKSLYDGLNKGIVKSSGKFICVMHSGDFFCNDHVLTKIAEKIKNHDIYCGNVYFYKRNKIIRTWVHPFTKLNKYNFYKIAHTSMFIKSQLIKNLPYDIRYKISSDTNLIIFLLKKKNIFKYLNIDITYMASDGLSTNKKFFFRKFKEDIIILYNHFYFIFFFLYFLKLYNKVYDFFFINKNVTNKFIKERNRLNFFIPSLINILSIFNSLLPYTFK